MGEVWNNNINVAISISAHIFTNVIVYCEDENKLEKSFSPHAMISQSCSISGPRSLHGSHDADIYLHFNESEIEETSSGKRSVAKMKAAVCCPITCDWREQVGGPAGKSNLCCKYKTCWINQDQQSVPRSREAVKDDSVLNGAEEEIRNLHIRFITAATL